MTEIIKWSFLQCKVIAIVKWPFPKKPWFRSTFMKVLMMKDWCSVCSFMSLINVLMTKDWCTCGKSCFISDILLSDDKISKNLLSKYEHMQVCELMTSYNSKFRLMF